MDPITTAIASALGQLGSSVIKDAYNALKAAIAHKCGVDSDLVEAIESLEKKPESTGRKETLKEEVTAAKVDQDPEIVGTAQSLLNELDKIGFQSGSSTIIQQAGDQTIQIAGSVSRSTISVITEGIGKREFNRSQSDYSNNEGRKRVRTFGERMARREGWDWWPLGQAIEYYVESIRHDPQNQHPWINLAYVYHLIGERQKSLECLDMGFELAGPGPNHPGRHYKQVKQAIDNHSHLSGGRVNRPPMPDWFRNDYDQFL